MRDAEMTPLMGSELECPGCGTVAVNQDFCACGEYLAWELTTRPTATLASEPAAYRPPAPPEARDSTLLTLRDPAGLDEAGAAIAVSVAPGTTVALLATVRNQGEIVDAFDVRVDGLPDTWWTVSPTTVFLNPWGTAGEYEQEVQVHLHPPRASEAEARAWPVTVVAHSRALGAGRRARTGDADHRALPGHGAPRRPGTPPRPPARGLQRASSRTVATRPIEMAIDAEDTAARCPITVIAERTTVPVGGSSAAVVRARVPYPLIFARPVDHRLTITHRTSGAESEQEPSRVTFQQRPWLPWWLPPVLALLAALITLVCCTSATRRRPTSRGRTVANATKLLKKHHLRIGSTTYAPAPEGVIPYSILTQVPDAGAEVVRTTSTSSSPRRRRPRSSRRSTGSRSARRRDALTAAHFANNAQPGSAGDDWIVIRQDPAPGSTRDVGTPVTLAVESPTPAPTPTPTATTTPTTTPTATPTAVKTAAPKSPAKSAAAKSTAAKAAGRATAKAAAIPSLPADLHLRRRDQRPALPVGESGKAKAESLTSADVPARDADEDRRRLRGRAGPRRRAPARVDRRRRQDGRPDRRRRLLPPRLLAGPRPAGRDRRRRPGRRRPTRAASA